MVIRRGSEGDYVHRHSRSGFPTVQWAGIWLAGTLVSASLQAMSPGLPSIVGLEVVLVLPFSLVRYAPAHCGQTRTGLSPSLCVVVLEVMPGRDLGGR
jgi:hypothetical protein